MLPAAAGVPPLPAAGLTVVALMLVPPVAADPDVLVSGAVPSPLSAAEQPDKKRPVSSAVAGTMQTLSESRRERVRGCLESLFMVLSLLKICCRQASARSHLTQLIIRWMADLTFADACVVTS